MFRRSGVDPNQNWWEVRSWEKARTLIHQQVKAALSGHEFAFFVEHDIGEVFSWIHLDKWLREHSVRFDGPSQYSGRSFNSFTDELKDYVHYTETRDASIFALQKWSIDHGDGRLVGIIESIADFHEDQERYKKTPTHDMRSEWKPGHAKIGDPPALRYFINKQSAKIAANVSLYYKFDEDVGDYVYAQAYRNLLS